MGRSSSLGRNRGDGRGITGHRKRWGVLALIPTLTLLSGCAGAASGPGGSIQIDLGATGQPQEMAATVQILLLLTFLSLAPAFVILTTSFTRIIIVLSFVRSAIGIAQLPPNQVLLGLALFLTVFVMAPVWQQANAESFQPYMDGEISQEVAMERGLEPLRSFMMRQTREKDLSLLIYMAKADSPETPKDVPTHVLIPAFVISELETGFQMGLLIFLPFLVIDLVVSSVLMSLGMMMLPPAVISLPFKVLLFVLVDGWHLVVRSLLVSFA